MTIFQAPISHNTFESYKREASHIREIFLFEKQITLLERQIRELSRQVESLESERDHYKNIVMDF